MPKKLSEQDPLLFLFKKREDCELEMEGVVHEIVNWPLVAAMEVNNNILDTMQLWSTSSDGMQPVRLPTSKDLARDSAQNHKSKTVKKFPETARRIPTAYVTALNMGDHATTQWRRISCQMKPQGLRPCGLQFAGFCVGSHSF